MTKTEQDAPIYLTSKTVKVVGTVAAVGPAEVLAAAYQAGAPVALSGKHAGERVYLGHTRQTYDDGVTVETIGEDRTWEHDGLQVAAYLIDMTRLQDAPKLAALNDKVQQARMREAVEMEARVAAEDARLENLAEDGA